MPYYKNINGIKYDRQLLELAESLSDNHPNQALTLADAEQLYQMIVDGGKITEVEDRTIRYIISQHSWEKEAKAKLLSEIQTLEEGTAPVKGTPLTSDLTTNDTTTKQAEISQTAPPALSQKDNSAPIRKLLSIQDDGTIPNQTITINPETLASIDVMKLIPEMIEEAFSTLTEKAQPIIIKNASANIKGKGPYLTIQGEAAFRLSTKPVKTILRMNIIDDQVQALMSFTMIGDDPIRKNDPIVKNNATTAVWKFSDSFPDIPTVIRLNEPGQTPRSALNDLIMNNAEFLVSTQGCTYQNQTLVQGINFRAEMQPTGILSIFETIIGHNDQLSLQGTVRLPQSKDDTMPVLDPLDFPWHSTKTPIGISLKTDLKIAKQNVGNKMTIDVENFRLYSPTSWSSFSANPSYKPMLAYTGSITVPSLNTDLGITVVSPPGIHEVELVADFSQTPLSHFSELVDMVGLSDIEQKLPQPIQSGMNKLGIQAASLILGYEKGLSVKSTSVTVGMPNLQWHVWQDEDLLTVDSILCNIEVFNPFSSPQLNLAVFGKLEIEGVIIDVNAYLSNGFQVVASSGASFNIPLKGLMHSYAPGVPAVSDLTIDSFTVSVDPGKYYFMMLSMADAPNPWKIDLGGNAHKNFRQTLTFSDVGIMLMKSSSAGITGNFSGTTQIGDLTLNANYDIPGDISIRADLPSIKLSELVDFFVKTALIGPSGFDLTLEQSYVLIQKQNSDYELALGTTVENLGSLFFVIQKNTDWGFAAGIDIQLDNLKNLPAVGSEIQKFTSWFPFNELTLIVSSITDQSFTFPASSSFEQASFSPAQLQLPGIANGISEGFFLYTSTQFSQNNKVQKLLMDLLHIPAGTELDAFFSYQEESDIFKLGVSLTTYLTESSDPQSKPLASHPYKNTELKGIVDIELGGDNGFELTLTADVKTTIKDQQLELDAMLMVEPNGLFISGTMKEGATTNTNGNTSTAATTLNFGPVEIGDIAIELGISDEGLPSFGFSGEIAVSDFDSSIAILLNTSEPEDSMIAGAVSNINIGDVLDHFIDDASSLDIPIPTGVTDSVESGAIGSFLKTISIDGPKEGSFIVKQDQATAFETALNSYNGQSIAQVFSANGHTDFPTSSPNLMIFKPKPNAQHKVWFITEQAANSQPVHWQVTLETDGSINVSKEAQFYLQPSPQPINIGTITYQPGFMLAGRITFLSFDVEADIQIEKGKGILVEADMSAITFISKDLFAITAEKGSGGPSVNICTYNRPEVQKKQFRAPHFCINGNLSLLGSDFGFYSYVSSKSVFFEIDVSVIDLLSGHFKGSYGKSVSESIAFSEIQVPSMSANAEINVGINSIDLGPLGTYKIDTGATASFSIKAIGPTYSVTVSFGVEVLGKSHTYDFTWDINTHKIDKLVGIVEEKIKSELESVFDDPGKFAEACAKGLFDGVDTGSKDVVKAMKDTKKFVVGAVSSALKDTFNILNPTHLGSLLQQASYETEDLKEGIESAFNNITSENMIHILHGLNVPLNIISAVIGIPASIAQEILDSGLGSIYSVAGATTGFVLNSASESASVVLGAGSSVASKGVHIVKSVVHDAEPWHW